MNVSELDSRCRWIAALLGLFTLVLIGATWPLWWDWPSADSPRIPCGDLFVNIPGGVDRAALVGLIVSCAGLIIGGPTRLQQITRWGYLVSLGLLVLLDQHRLQPWVVQFLLFALFLNVSSRAPLLNSWKLIVASIYIWSAISKWDATFFTQQGQLFLQGLLEPIGIDTGLWTPQFKSRMAMVFPIGEFLAGLLLLLPVTRRWGLPLTIVMHIALIWTLAIGLKHEWGVIIWNVYFIIQNLLLFGPDVARNRNRKAIVTDTSESPDAYPERGWVRTLLLLAVIYPALETAGQCDHWPAWAVYCARPEQVKIMIDEHEADQLPEALKKHLGSADFVDERRPLNLDGWCFENRHCPIYPQERFRLALALALLKPYVSDRGIAVEVRSTPDRETGERIITRLHGMKAIESRCDQFRMNTKARE